MIAFCRALAVLLLLTAVGESAQEESEAAKKERMFQETLREIQRGLAELDAKQAKEALPEGARTSLVSNTNIEPMLRQFFDSNWIHSSFGRRWDDIPAPTIVGSNAVASAERFIAENGWDMLTNRFTFLTLITQQGEDIRGLPWEVIKDRTFRAATHHGVLFIPLRFSIPVGSSGVAYNPRTNRLDSVRAFKHLGGHWYAWLQDDIGHPTESRYEGDEK